MGENFPEGKGALLRLWGRKHPPGGSARAGCGGVLGWKEGVLSRVKDLEFYPV